jgi:hypothetical protein
MRFAQTVRGGFARAVAVGAGLLLLGAPATASIMRFLSIEELAGESALVVRARITGQSVHWTANQEGIYTEIQAVVLGDIASGTIQGPAAQGRRLTIIQAGGEIDGVSLDWTGRPTFRDGEDLVLFLQSYDPAVPGDSRYLVVGGKQGRMRVIEDPTGRSAPMVERDLVGVLDAPFIEGDEPKGPAPRRDLMGLEELRSRARAARGGRP